MVYDNEKQMEKVLGRIEDNPFIRLNQQISQQYQQQVQQIIQAWQAHVA